MPAKKTSKKKPLTKQESNRNYLIRKKEKEKAASTAAAAAAFEAALSPEPVKAEEPLTTSTPHEMEVFDDDGFNEWAPNQGMGDNPLNVETGEWKTPEVPTVETNPPDAGSLLSPEPVEASAPPVPHIVPQELPDALETPPDALIVERLINAVNHLYGIARLTKGQKGPQPEHIAKIITNIKHARNLVERLK